VVQDRKRALGEHLEELRRRLLVVVVALLVGAVVSFVFYRQVISWLLLPARDLFSVTGKPVFTEVTEFLGVTVRIAILGGFVLAVPVLVYEALMFVAPGLTPKERRYTLSFIPGALLCFAGGVAFAYFVLLPPALRFLLTFGSDVATPMIRIGNYVNLVVTLLFWIGVVFETPLAMFLLSRLGVVSADTFARERRVAFVAAFLLGAIITPTFDPLNQALVAAPLIVLYEAGIWLARLGRPKARADRKGTKNGAKE
jgi:sec-independent protein translocase protein TatC